MCAWVGMALMGVLLTWLLLGRNVTSAKPGFFIFGYGAVVTAFQFGGHAIAVMVLAALGVGGGLALAAYTEGLQRAPEWGIYAASALAFGGVLAALPILWTIAVCLLNLALWILYVVLIAVFVCFCVWAFFAMLADL